ncbi:MAG: hypothetical protein R3190_04990, partial [Thermoanaerobaculia bacterium]|nr:hypothetical protein [Thermoanaerobaculia bacterium]
RDAVGRRLNQLSQGCNDVLSVAAVLGREFDAGVVAAVAGLNRDEIGQALAEALAARLLTEAEGLEKFRFSHALVRETLYDELPTPRRVALHRRAGDVLAETASGELGPHTAAIAHHLFQSVQAGDPTRAVEACERAAEWARQRQAWEEAGLHFQRAAQVLDAVGAAEDSLRLAGILVAQAEMQGLGHDVEGARQAALRAVAIAREHGDAPLLARAALAYGAGVAFVEAGRVDTTMTGLLEEALAALGSSPSPLRARLLQRLGQEHLFSTDLERRNAYLDEALAIARGLGDRSLEVELLSVQGFRSLDDLSGLKDNGTAAATLALEEGNLEAAVQGWAQSLGGAWWEVDRAGVERGLAEVERLGGELRTANSRALAVAAGTALALAEGRFDSARRRIEELRSISQISTYRQWVGTQLFVLNWLTGEELPPITAERLVERYPSVLIYRGFLLGCLASEDLRNDAQRELSEVAALGFGRDNRDTSWSPSLALFTMACHRLGLVEHAETLAELLSDKAGRWISVPPCGVGPLGPGDLHLGHLALLRGRNEEARDHYLGAVGVCEALRTPPFEALARLGVATATARAGLATQVASELDRALELGRSLGMKRVVQDGLALKLELQGEAAEGETLALDH